MRSADVPRPATRSRSGLLVGAVIAAALLVGSVAGLYSGRSTLSDAHVAASDAGGTDPRTPESVPIVGATITTVTGATSPPPTVTTPSSVTTQGTQTTSPTTSPPATTEPTAPGGSTTPDGSTEFYQAFDFSDPAHRVVLAVPTSFEETYAFDGRKAAWSDGRMTLTYVVIPDQDAADATARKALLNSQVQGDPDRYSTTKVDTDGRYAVSGATGSGWRLYERGKIRCGDLAYYRLDFRGDFNDPLAEAIVERLYDDTSELDAIGGNLASC